MSEATDRSLYGFIKAACEEQEEKIVWYERRLTAGEVFRDVEALARFLVSVGVQKGDGVLLSLPNFPDAVVALYAINASGAVADIVHPNVGEEKLISVMEETGVRVAFLYDKAYKKAAKTLRERKIITILCSPGDYAPQPPRQRANRFARRREGVYSYAEAKKDGVEMPPEPIGDDLAAYLHSSGTTGKAKTVALTNRALNELAQNVYDTVIKRAPDADGKAMLMTLPLFHGFGLGICVHLTMLFGKIVPVPRFRAGSAIRAMKREEIAFLALVPGMLRRLVRKKAFGSVVSGVKYVFVGGDALPATLREEAQDILSEHGNGKIAEGFGLSETAGVTHINLDGKAGSVGRPVRGVRQKIVREDGTETAAGETGELYLATPTMMRGYRTGEDPFVCDENGVEWLATGDLGYIDEEGFFFYQGRKKRLVKIGGINVYPQETESVAESLPFVESACAVRITWQGKHALRLLVTCKNGALTESRKRRIRDEIEKRLFRYAVPKEIVAVQSLKKTAIGKADYRYYEEQGGTKW